MLILQNWPPSCEHKHSNVRHYPALNKSAFTLTACGHIVSWKAFAASWAGVHGALEVSSQWFDTYGACYLSKCCPRTYQGSRLKFWNNSLLSWFCHSITDSLTADLGNWHWKAEAHLDWTYWASSRFVHGIVIEGVDFVCSIRCLGVCLDVGFRVDMMTVLLNSLNFWCMSQLFLYF
jgi:hypothetical protein